MKVALVLGTRPEAIKLAPVYFELIARGCDVDIVSTGQHRELLTQTLDIFGLSPDVDLSLMQPNQTLHGLTAAAINGLGILFQDRVYEYVVVQGDTTTAFCAGLAAFYQRIPVGHVEAGLRTGDPYSPYPEEVNRRLLSVVARHHFCPTQGAVNNLLREGHVPQTIILTGNTVIDALRWVTERKADAVRTARGELDVSGRPYFLMTTHRRESFGGPMESVLRAVRAFLAENPDIELILPMHRNPHARHAVSTLLEQVPNARLIDSVDYVTFVGLMEGSLFIVTDSGGIQEEAPYFNKRTLVVRDVTERPEAIEAGTAKLVGTDSDTLLRAMTHAMAEVRNGRSPDIRDRNPFGDGYAAGRIADVVVDTP